MLGQGIGHDHVADGDAGSDPAGDAGEDHRTRVEDVEHGGGGGRRSNLAESALRQDHGMVPEASGGEGPAGDGMMLRPGESAAQQADLFLHRPQDAEPRRH